MMAENGIVEHSSEKTASWVSDDIRKALHKNMEVGFHERPDTSPGLHKET